MTHLLMWNQLLTFYRDTSRLAMLRKQGKERLFWSLISLYGLVSLAGIVVVIETQWFLPPTLVIAGTAWLINVYLNKRLYAPLVDTAKHFSLEEVERQARYQRFRRLVHDSLPTVLEQLPALVEWHGIRIQRYQRKKLITHSVTLLIFGSSLGLLFSSELIQKNAIEVAILILFILLLAVIFLDMLTELFFFKEQSAFEVNRFLQWLMLEPKDAPKLYHHD